MVIKAIETGIILSIVDIYIKLFCVEKGPGADQTTATTELHEAAFQICENV